MATDEPLLDVRGVYRKFSRSATFARKYGMRQVFRNLVGLTSSDGEARTGEFWALKNISIQLHRGETLAVMGLNGAGKSTLLKVIGGLLLPSRGTVRVRGKLDSLIELGTGFHPALSGKENIFIRCAFNGMGRRETEGVFERIVDFAELQEFIDMPLKNYSSGMYARLGFAAAIFTQPDILLVDEVLSVGDFTFRQKCLDKMNKIKEKSAIVFVSHSFGAVRMFCERGIVLDRGQKTFDGSAKDAIDLLIAQENERQQRPQEKKPAIPENAEIRLPTKGPRGVWGPKFHNKQKLIEVSCVWRNERGDARIAFERGANLTLDFSFQLLESTQNLIIGVALWNHKDELVTSFATDAEAIRIDVNSNGRVRARLVVEGGLNSGNFYGTFAICDGPEFLYRNYLDAIRITGNHPRLFGSSILPHRWEQVTTG